MNENPQQKQRHWRGPIIGSALGIPGAGALIVTIVTLIFLHNAGAVHLAWSSAGAIALSLLISFVLLFIVFVLGIAFALRGAPKTVTWAFVGAVLFSFAIWFPFRWY